MKSEAPSVLACVTCQYDCDRIIRTARKIADDCDCELRVLSVLKPMSNYADISEQIEYLYSVSKENNADMTVLFADDAAKATCGFVVKNNVQRIVTGMHDGKSNSFILRLNKLSPSTSISMISKNNMVYSLELCPCYSR